MKQFIPYEKLSKRQKREADAQARGQWSISPVTRKPQNPKAYNRAKTRQRDRNDPFAVFSYSRAAEAKCVIQLQAAFSTMVTSPQTEGASYSVLSLA